MTPYPLPTLNALGDGCVLDARAKLAMAILASPGFVGTLETSGEYSWAQIAKCALGVSEAFYEQAEARGLVKPLPVDSTLPPAEIAHIERQAGANVHGQLHAQKVAQNSAPMVAPVGLFPQRQ
jgi:hypothetical protein